MNPLHHLAQVSLSMHRNVFCSRKRIMKIVILIDFVVDLGIVTAPLSGNAEKDERLFMLDDMEMAFIRAVAA